MICLREGSFGETNKKVKKLFTRRIRFDIMLFGFFMEPGRKEV